MRGALPNLILFVQFKKCVTEACNFTKSNTPPWAFFTFFINGTKSRKASHYKHHRSMKKWVKRENWNIENKWNIFQATFNVIFFSPVLIFKNIKIEVKKSLFWRCISCSLSLNYKRPSHSGGLFVMSILNFVFEHKNELI